MHGTHQGKQKQNATLTHAHTDKQKGTISQNQY